METKTNKAGETLVNMAPVYDDFGNEIRNEDGFLLDANGETIYNLSLGVVQPVVGHYICIKNRTHFNGSFRLRDTLCGKIFKSYPNVGDEYVTGKIVDGKLILISDGAEITPHKFTCMRCFSILKKQMPDIKQQP